MPRKNRRASAGWRSSPRGFATYSTCVYCGSPTAGGEMCERCFADSVRGWPGAPPFPGVGASSKPRRQKARHLGLWGARANPEGWCHYCGAPLDQCECPTGDYRAPRAPKAPRQARPAARNPALTGAFVRAQQVHDAYLNFGRDRAYQLASELARSRQEANDLDAMLADLDERSERGNPRGRQAVRFAPRFPTPSDNPRGRRSRRNAEGAPVAPVSAAPVAPKKEAQVAQVAPSAPLAASNPDRFPSDLARYVACVIASDNNPTPRGVARSMNAALKDAASGKQRSFVLPPAPRNPLTSAVVAALAASSANTPRGVKIVVNRARRAGPSASNPQLSIIG